MKESIIIDANRLSNIVGRPSQQARFARLVNELSEGNLKLAFGGSTLKKEYEAVDGAMDLVQELERSGQLDSAPLDQIDAEEAAMKLLQLHSDDEHILAVARKTLGRVLISNDRRLMQDFLNPGLVNNPRGFIYSSDANWAAMRKRFA